MIYTNGDGNLSNEPFGGKVDQWRDKSGHSRHAGNGDSPPYSLTDGIEKHAVQWHFQLQPLKIPMFLISGRWEPFLSYPKDMIRSTGDRFFQKEEKIKRVAI